MSKSLRSIPDAERDAVIVRRILGNTGGLGYLAAMEAKRKRDEEKAKKKDK